MGRYYNATRGPLSLPLPRGRSVSIPPKKWITIDPSDEGAERVLTFTRKGFLVREKVSSVVSAPEVLEAAKPVEKMEVPRVESPPEPVTEMPVEVKSEEMTEDKAETTENPEKRRRGRFFMKE